MLSGRPLVLFFVAAFFVATVFAGPASATPGVPDPDASIISDMITLIPGPNLWPGYEWNLMTIRDSEDFRLPGAQVEIIFDDYDLLCWCPGTDPGNSVTAITDIDGMVSFELHGGGCIPSMAARVFADGIFMKNCGVNSPDVVDNLARMPSDSGYVAATYAEGCGVNAVDVVWHNPSILFALVEPCTKFDGQPADSSVSILDAVLLTPFVVERSACASGGPVLLPPMPTLTKTKLAFHIQEFGPWPACDLNVDPVCEDSGGTNLINIGAVGQGYCIYTIALDIDTSVGLAGISFGLSYSTGISNIFLGAWGETPGSQSYYDPGWPGAGGSLVFTHSGSLCEDTPAPGDPEGEAIEVMGSVYAYAYAPGELEFVASPDLHAVDCSLVLTDLSIWPDNLGRAGFGVNGYNPCLATVLDVPHETILGRLRAFPNPTSGALTVELSGDHDWVIVDIYNIAGRRVKQLWKGRPSGSRLARWDGVLDSGLRAPSGTYFIRVESDQGSWAQRVTLIR